MKTNQTDNTPNFVLDSDIYEYGKTDSRFPVLSRHISLFNDDYSVILRHRLYGDIYAHFTREEYRQKASTCFVKVCIDFLALGRRAIYRLGYELPESENTIQIAVPDEIDDIMRAFNLESEVEKEELLLLPVYIFRAVEPERKLWKIIHELSKEDFFNA